MQAREEVLFGENYRKAIDMGPRVPKSGVSRHRTVSSAEIVPVRHGVGTAWCPPALGAQRI